MLGTETLSWHTILPDLLRRGSVVVDLGANVGGFSRAAMKRFDCICYAVEAVPELSASIPSSPRLQVLNRAICDRPRRVMLHVSHQSDASSLLEIAPDLVARAIEVEGTDIGSLAKELDLREIDLLKVDIEGAEIEMFDSMPDDLLRRIRQITVEFHDFCGLVTPAEISRVSARLMQLGFARFKFSRRDHSNVLFVNRQAAGLSRSRELYVRFGARPALRVWWPTRRWLRIEQ